MKNVCKVQTYRDLSHQQEVVMHTKYLVQLLFAVLMTASTLAVGAGKYYCKIGADPVNTNRQLSPDEKVVVLAEDLFVLLSSGSGHVCRGWLRAGEKVVVSETRGKSPWVKRCGNDVLNDVYFRARTTAPPPVAYRPPPERTRQASAAPISFNFNVNPEVMRPYDDCVGSCADANRITAVAVGVLGSVAIGYGISRSGDRITNNNGGTVVTPPSPGPGHGGSTNPPGPGHGGSTNPPPVVVVEDPPFVYPGNGGGTNPPVVVDPPFVYPGNDGGSGPGYGQ
ncbi:MAG: hypothetical protein A2675_04215 [Candidatus Yonathbacteria bacterium RIFCSPHIGHO2_01_FULL_51_10]|uniref:Uncharacterized protein n=1 Tax=Candidatus Yonathbacteria bacterium RIFCSPHIGHO2_01_FULL_51_10 TaxID=1802723 RepID=A0A1G2S657_9BACT|nr:MAG: hypothetical protein A2675_04215 [Candidatus Yonathbacteria bacterium RIFCSPHIGHO2_01_FULL_51_10]